MAKLDKYTVDGHADCLEALRKIDANRKGFVIVVDEERRCLGVLTDGDVRRTVLATNGNLIDVEVLEACTLNFTYAHQDVTLSTLVELFEDRRIGFVPVVSVDGTLLDIVTRDQMQSMVLRCIELPPVGEIHLVDEASVDAELHRRPWGMYKTTVLQEHYQSKIIHVNPGSRMSLQYHLRREELWTVAGGTGVAQIGESFMPMRPGDTFFIPKGCKHRMENVSEKDILIVSEVQIGDYFSEDDIIRLEDDYGRASEAEHA